MAPSMRTLAALVSPSQLLPLWGLLKHLPGGGRMLGRLAGRMAPYTGTIRPEVLSLEPGAVRVLMRDRRRVRNHLNSVHAIALMNLGEVSTGMAVLSALPAGVRGIITQLSMDYLKKARGPITATCTCPAVTSTEKQDLEVHAELTNEAGEVVARAHARWRVGA
jgi:acyl-coenzyme A thioesterase PaaI-like protein